MAEIPDPARSGQASPNAWPAAVAGFVVNVIVLLSIRPSSSGNSAFERAGDIAGGIGTVIAALVWPLVVVAFSSMWRSHRTQKTPVQVFAIASVVMAVLQLASHFVLFPPDTEITSVSTASAVTSAGTVTSAGAVTSAAIPATTTAASNDAGAAEDASKELKAYVDKLVTLRRAVRAVRPPVTKKCVDADLGEGGPVDAAEEEALAALEQGTELPRGFKSFTTWRDLFGPRFAILAEMRAKGQPMSETGWTSEIIRRWNAEKYLLVIRSEYKVMPQREGLIAGDFKGWVFVGDLGAGKVLCQTRLAFGSSSRIKMNWLDAHPLDLDFRSKATEALRYALGSLTLKLVPSVLGR